MMNTTKKSGQIFLGYLNRISILAVLLMVPFSESFAENPDAMDGFPIPYASLNQRVELAHGEVYTLAGQVQCIGDRIYFQVDFDFHPWLKSKNRATRKYYPLSGSSAMWTPLDQEKVQVFVRARSVIYKWRGSFRHEIVLDSVFDPRRID